MYFKLHNKLYSCTLWKGCALLELAVFFRKKGEAESKIKIKSQNSNPIAGGEDKCRKVESSNHLEKSVKSSPQKLVIDRKFAFIAKLWKSKLKVVCQIIYAPKKSCEIYSFCCLDAPQIHFAASSSKVKRKILSKSQIRLRKSWPSCT